MLKNLLKTGLLGVVLLTGSNLQAAIYSTTDAYKHDNPGDHTLWLPGLASDNDWIADGDGVFNVTDSGAIFSGSVKNQGNGDLTADFTFVFTNARKFSNGTTGDPKKELAGSDYKEMGGPVDTDTWRYFDLFGGIMSGTGLASGFAVGFWQDPHPARTSIGAGNDYRFQFGEGANGKNTGLGVSGWLTWFAIVPNSCSICANAGLENGEFGRGDINIDVSAVPVPAAFWLFGTALIGFVGISRKTKIS